MSCRSPIIISRMELHIFMLRMNKGISIGCANGDVMPFVVHNAFLRWSARQDGVLEDPADSKKKILSESNVSEDFDIELCLQLKIIH
jgi:hypothetical protein